MRVCVAEVVNVLSLDSERVKVHPGFCIPLFKPPPQHDEQSPEPDGTRACCACLSFVCAAAADKPLLTLVCKDEQQCAALSALIVKAIQT